MTEPCEKCGGHGWVWAKELDKYHGDPAELAFDDTRYDCDACDSPRMPVSAARRPKAEDTQRSEASHHASPVTPNPPECTTGNTDELDDDGLTAAYMMGSANERERTRELVKAVERMLDAIDKGAVDSEEIVPVPGDGPPYRFHEEWAHHARRALSNMGEG